MAYCRVDDERSNGDVHHLQPRGNNRQPARLPTTVWVAGESALVDGGAEWGTWIAQLRLGAGPPKPDLVVIAVSNPPASALPGATLLVSDTVRNQGFEGAGRSATRYYLSFDRVKNTGDRLLGGSRAVPALPAGVQSTGIVRVGIPRATPPNRYFLLACADDTKAVGEGNEGNNCRASTTTITILRR
jgi:hypothetical protein